MRLRPGLHPDPAGGAYIAAPDPLAGFKGAAGMGRGKGGKGKGKGGEGQGGRGEGRLTLTRSWNRAADWLRPALDPLVATFTFCLCGCHVTSDQIR